jgi:uroporphyrin-III C-methyltransferase
MAMSKLEAITDIFKELGKGETAAAIIQHGTSPEMKMVTGKVKDIFFRAQYADLGNPAVILIGDVVNLNRNLVNKVNSFDFSVYDRK